MIARAFMSGIDGLKMATTEDMAEAIVLVAATRKAEELQVERDEALARKIRNEIAAAWNKGNS